VQISGSLPSAMGRPRKEMTGKDSMKI